MSENPYRIVECPHCHEEVSVKSFETERRIHLETIERLHREIAALRHATTDEPELRAAAEKLVRVWPMRRAREAARLELAAVLAATPRTADRDDRDRLLDPTDLDAIIGNFESSLRVLREHFASIASTPDDRDRYCIHGERDTSDCPDCGLGFITEPPDDRDREVERIAALEDALRLAHQALRDRERKAGKTIASDVALYAHATLEGLRMEPGLAARIAGLRASGGTEG